MKNERQCQPIIWKDAKRALQRLEKNGDFENLLLLAVGFYTGFRIGDILSLKFSDFKGDVLTMSEQKTSKQRSLPISSTLARIVGLVRDEMSKNDSHYLFTNSRYNCNKPITTAAAITRIKTALESCGFSEAKSGNLSAHTLRKTFALYYYELMSSQVGEYRALSELAKQLNHSNTDVTRRYICLDKATVATVFAMFD